MKNGTHTCTSCHLPGQGLCLISCEHMVAAHPHIAVFVAGNAVSKALEQLDAANREAAGAKQRAEHLEHELSRIQQQAVSAEAQVDRWASSHQQQAPQQPRVY